MGNVIDFTEGTDTGEADVESIKPIKNGEDLDQVTIPRADQNLRQRTEKLRSEANQNRWVRDADRSMKVYITAGSLTWNGHVTGGGDGKLVLSGGDLILMPLTSPGEPRAAANEGIGTIFPDRFAFAEFDDGNGVLFNLQAKASRSGGGDQVTFETITDVGHGPLSIEVIGATVPNPATQPGARKIVVTYDPAESEDWSDVVTAITGLTEADALVDISYAPAPDQPLFDTLQVLAGAGDGVLHQITAAKLADFFLIADNLLREGDTLAIWYDNPQLRRESTEELGNHLISDSNLVNLSAEPDKAPDCVPIGRVIQDKFVIAHCASLTKAQPHAPNQINQGDAASIPADPSTWTTLAGGDVQAALGSADAATTAVAAGVTVLRQDLNRGLSVTPVAGDAGTYGAEYVGIDPAPTYRAIAPGTESAQGALADLDGWAVGINDPLVVIPVGGDGSQRVGVTPGDLPTIGPDMASDHVKSALQVIDNKLTVYASVQEFLDSTVPGDTGVVDFFDPTIRPYQLAGSQDLAGAGTSYVQGIDSDGQYIYVMYEAPGVVHVAERYHIDDLTTPVTTYILSGVPTSNGVFKDVSTNGDVVAFGYDTTVDVFPVGDGTVPARLTHVPGGTVNQIELDSLALYVAATNGDIERVLLSNIPGGDTWAVSLAVQAKGIKSDGVNIIVTSPLTATFDVRRYDINGIVQGVYTLPSGSAGNTTGNVVLDRNFAYFTHTDGVTEGFVTSISKWGQVVGPDRILAENRSVKQETRWFSGALGSTNPNWGIAVDHRNLYVVSPGDGVDILDKATLAPLASIAAAGSVGNRLTTTGGLLVHFYVSSTNILKLQTIRVRDTERTLFTHVDPTTAAYLSYRWKAIPREDAT